MSSASGPPLPSITLKARFKCLAQFPEAEIMHYTEVSWRRQDREADDFTSKVNMTSMGSSRWRSEVML